MDTIGDISKATYESARDTAQKAQQSASYKLQLAMDTTTKKANQFWSNTKDKMKAARDVVSEKLDATSKGAKHLKHSTAEGLRDKIRQYRVGTAIGLDRLSDMLRGRKEEMRTVPKPEPAKVIENEQLPDIKTNEDKKTFLTPKMRAKFIEFYVRNHETAHRVFEDLDRQHNPQPKLSDYMIRSGFDAFLETVIDAPDVNELREAAKADMIKDDELQSFKNLAQQIDQNMMIQDEIIKAHNEKQTAQKSEQSRQPVKNPHETAYNPPAVTTPYDASLYDELPPDFGHHETPEYPAEFHHDQLEITAEDLSEFENFDDMQL